MERMEQGVSVGEVARALEVNPNVLQRWRREFRQGSGNAFPGLGKRRWAEGRVAELERKIGQQAGNWPPWRKAFRLAVRQKRISAAPACAKSLTRQFSKQNRRVSDRK
jgi:transposase-like protein